MSTREDLLEISFGKRVAEEEADTLATYFVETEQWRRVYSGEVDVVKGPKGSGKSALYSLLMNRESDLFDRGILLTAAENPRGTPVFADLVTDPPTSEEEFRSLWKLYFLSLVGRQLRDYGIENEAANRVISLLEEANLIAPVGLRALLRTVIDYVRRTLAVESAEGEIRINPLTGLPEGLVGRITFREPTSAQREIGFISASSVLELADEALATENLALWIALDRLDVAFAETPDLEANALRALFRVYVDLLALSGIKLKIFLRDDIWRRITAEGFREASHITRDLTINWNERSLLNLVVRRMLGNPIIVERYGVSPVSVLDSVDEQRKLFYMVFPAQVDLGSRRPETFNWMLTRTQDGTGQTAPRELIHLLEASRTMQLHRLEIGEDEPSDDRLFSAGTIKAALPEVSKARLEQTLYAEYPESKRWIEALEGEKTDQDPASLAAVWGCSEEQAAERAYTLVEIGFFEQRGTNAEPRFWVPFLYRDALEMVQGSAD